MYHFVIMIIYLLFRMITAHFTSFQPLYELTSLFDDCNILFADDPSFYTLLVKFIHGALKQRERDRVDEKDWVVDEAMNARKLQNGGTFRNVLARRIDEAIIPFFSKIISSIDQNCNLNLLTDPKKQTSPLSQFWLAMFEHIHIDFTDCIARGKTTLLVRTDFHCQLPFSWIVKEAVDAAGIASIVYFIYIIYWPVWVSPVFIMTYLLHCYMI